MTKATRHFVTPLRKRLVLAVLCFIASGRRSGSYSRATETLNTTDANHW